MRSYTRARLLGATALAVAVLVALAPVAGATTAPPKVQVTVTDDFSSGSIRFVVAGVPSALEADTYKVGLTNNSIGPHVLVAVGGLPDDITVEEFIEGLDAGRRRRGSLRPSARGCGPCWWWAGRAGPR
jgi:hypothetical protein